MGHNKQRKLLGWEFVALPAAALHFFLRGFYSLMGATLILMVFFFYYVKKNNRG